MNTSTNQILPRALVLLLSSPIGMHVAWAQPGGGPPPSYQQPLVERFDADKNGRIEADERVAALEWIRIEREKNPPRRRGGPGGSAPSSDLRPRQISKEEAEHYADHELFDVNVIRTMFLDFEQSDWADEMVMLWRTEISTRAKLTVDGTEYPDVGVRYRGSSSFFSVLAHPKKSFAISLDWGGHERRLQGFKSLNLLSGHADPTYMRTVLFSHIANHYLPTPKSCFVHLVVNGESWGLYINDQQINKRFTEQAFGKKGGARWKIPPNFQGEAALAYQGPRVEDYSSKYELASTKSNKEAWDRLIELCNTLSNGTPEELEERLPKQLNIDHTLWFLAVDNVLMDGDGYHYRGSDYAIYMDKGGVFHPLFRDNNEAFSYGGGPGGFGRGNAFRRAPGSLTLDPLKHVNEERAALCKALFSVPAWRAQYLDNCRTITRDWMTWSKVGPIVESWKQRIEPLVKADDKGLYGYDAFLAGLHAGTDRKPGLQRFFEERGAYLAECDALANNDD